MADVKWIKLSTNVFDDEKIRYIETLPNGDETIVIWLKILCLAGKSNSSGLLMMTDKIAYTDEMLSSIFNRDVKSIQFALKIFENLSMIELIENRIYILNWEKHQNQDKLDYMKNLNRDRVQKYREKQIKTSENITKSLQDHYKNITSPLHDHYCNGTDIDIDKDLDKDKDIKDKDSTTLKRFIKPTLTELNEFITTEKLNIDAQYFLDYYESNGWLVGRNKMKDWKSTVRNWSRKQFTNKRYGRVEIVSDFSQEPIALSEEEKNSISNAFREIGEKK